MTGRHIYEKNPGAGVPGPGNYSPSTKIIDPSITVPFSFASKIGASIIKHGLSSQVFNPGPGKYDVVPNILTKKGAVFGTEQRPGVEIKAVVKIPGPGAYNSMKIPGKPSMPNIKYKNLFVYL